MTSRERILNAAIPVFARKGRYGAHMEDIAALAHINKAMIYYIFHNKDELYLEVLKLVFRKANESISPVAASMIKNRSDYIAVISDYISLQLDFFSENQDYTKILVDAMSSGAEEIVQAVDYLNDMVGEENDPMLNLKQFIERGKAAGIIRDIDTDQLMISIIGMVIIYFLSKSIKTAFYIEVQDEQKFLKERKESIIDLVLNSILIKDTKKSIRKRSNNKEEI